jgi:tetratricopeptide (TPR) repeat protein
MPLDPQQMLLIGISPGAVPVRTSKFFDTFNVNDFQLVAWNAESLVAETQEKAGQSFQREHDPFAYWRFKELYEKKLITILNWIRHEHVLVLFPCLFNSELKAHGPNGAVNVDINHFSPFSLVNLTEVSEGTLHVDDDFRSQFSQFIDILRCDLVISGEGVIPLFRASESRHENSKIAGAAFQVGKGAIIFSPSLKAWDNPRLLEYLEALAKLPDMLSSRVNALSERIGYSEVLGKLSDIDMLSGPVDPLPETTSALQRPALRLAALPALFIATNALSPVWAPQVERLLPWGEKRAAEGEASVALAARLSEIEKRPDFNTIKSAESALARRVDQLEAALSRLQEVPIGPPSSAPDPMPPAEGPPLSTEQTATGPLHAASPPLSTEVIAMLLARGDTFLRRGDVASARAFYERAADAGGGQAALRMGATFDPAFLGVRGDPAEARRWYQRARDLGEAEGERWLKSIETK